MTNRDENVLTRWSRLKRRSAERNSDADTARTKTKTTQFDAGSTPEIAEKKAAENHDVERLTEEDLPNIETLNYDSDFSMFLKSNVPAHLHRLAMKKLWRSDPVLANLDGLNDYDLDYTIKEVMNVAVQSAEDLARGTKRPTSSDLRAQDRQAREVARRTKDTTEREMAAAETEHVEEAEPALDSAEDGKDQVQPVPDINASRSDRANG